MERIFKLKNGRFQQIQVTRIFDNDFLKSPSFMFTETMHKVHKAEIVIDQLQKPVQIINKFILILFCLLIIFLFNGFFMSQEDYNNMDSKIENFIQKHNWLVEKIQPQNWREQLLFQNQACQLHKPMYNDKYYIVCDDLKNELIRKNIQKQNLILNPPANKKLQQFLMKEKQKMNKNKKKQQYYNHKVKKNRYNQRGRKLQSQQIQPIKVQIQNEDYTLKSNFTKKMSLSKKLFIFILIMLIKFIMVGFAMRYILNNRQQKIIQQKLQKFSQLENSKDDLIKMQINESQDELIFYIDKITCYKSCQNKKSLFNDDVSLNNFIMSTEKKKRKVNSEGDCTTTCKTVKMNNKQNMSQISDSLNTVYTMHQLKYYQIN